LLLSILRQAFQQTIQKVRVQGGEVTGALLKRDVRADLSALLPITVALERKSPARR
jgi:hypothetical protein